MKIILFTIGLFITILNAQIFQSVPKDKGVFINEGEDKYYCSSCGMSLPMYYKTNYIYQNHQYCSFYALLEANKGNFEDELKVVDAKKLKFIDAKKAFFVVGSKKPGTMTMNSKYAFETKEDALGFQKSNGGELLDFVSTLKIAKDDFAKDRAMIDTKKEKKIYKIGMKLYKARCNKIDAKSFNSIAELKGKLSGSCKTKKDKDLQAIATYLWDIENLGKKLRVIETLNIPKDAKCPICGMFVAKYPKWASMLEFEGKHYYFDGPKDMFKYIFEKGKDSIGEIYVSDYFTTKKVDGRKAFFVMGSDVYGPMGKDLVAFESDEAAYSFKNDHFGKKVMTFSEMTDEVLTYLK
ncbi:NosL family protein [Halarcobacter ebronensis]|uniref:NosL family protein n=1 Tax=Halarcobacter ebronensis TaxID=1462615 RepID=A0A4Q0YHC8_9BACT|nr:nitrous oxide reductase accessory protein NosL [Halarcobacter ebronensis]RXJ69134.1 NosL family protein [Halarcobacter ebronensis]